MIKKSWITLLACLSFILGVLFGNNCYEIPGFIVIILITLLILSYISQSKLVYFYILLIGFILGNNRIENYLNQEIINNIQSLTKEDEEIELTGTISRIPDTRNDKQKLTISNIKANNQEYNGNVLITTNPFPHYRTGQILSIVGELEKPKIFTEGFNYPGYLAINKIYAASYYPDIKIIGEESSLNSTLFDIRQKFINQTKKRIPPDLSGLLTGLLVGDKNNLSQTAYEKFQKTGLTHIIVVSGYNLTIFAVIINKLLRGKILPIINFILNIIIMLLFVILTGAEASIVRAFIMTCILIIAPLLSRQNNPTIAIMLTASIMIYLNPLILWYDAGFHLSFLATLGLFYFSQPIESILTNIKLPPIIKNPLTETTAAQITTTPYIMANFNQLALYTPISNILVLPFIPFIMFIGFISIVSSFLLPDLITSLFTQITSLLLKYIFKISDILLSLPYSTLEINFNPKWLLFYYLSIFITLKLILKKIDHRKNHII